MIARIASSVALCIIASNVASAQCPDGSPPPCGPMRDTRVAARLTVVPPAAAERAKRFLVLPFRNVTRQPDQEWLVEGSTTMISDALGRWQGISVVPDEKLYPALKRAAVTPGSVVEAAKVRRVAEETGGWTAVTGEVLATGGRVRVTARAVDVVSNKELVRAASEIDAKGDVRAAFDSISLKLLRSVGFDSVSADLATSTTSDLDAYRAYLKGLAHERRSEVKNGIAAFQEATKRDSNFALAWMHLAGMSQASDPTSILNPMSAAARQSARAVSLSSKLPPRQRDLVLANGAQFQAHFGEARGLFEGLIAKDSNDVEALAGLAGLEMFDPVLVTHGSTQRPRGSFNAAARYAKKVTQLDASRSAFFALLSSIYAQAGVPGSQPVIGVDREATSFPDLIGLVRTREHLRIYYPLLGDSIFLVPAESLSAIPKDSVKTLRRAAREIARQWGERWISVAADQPTPHQLMTELYMYDGEYQSALRELRAAESLGIQTPTWSAPSRRAVLLARSGDLAGSARLTDSLTNANFFSSPQTALTASDAAMWAFGLAILRARPDMFKTLLTQMMASRRMMGTTPDMNDVVAFMTLMGNHEPEDEPGIPRAFRARQLDTVLTHINEFAANDAVAPWLPIMLPMLGEVTYHDSTRKANLPKAADALVQRAGSGEQRARMERLAFEIAANAVESDSTVELDAQAYPWYRAGAEQLNAARLATQSRFHPSSATIAPDKITLEWKVDDAEPFARNRAETPMFQGEYKWIVAVSIPGREYRFQAAGMNKGPSMKASSGPLSEILTPTAARSVLTGVLNAQGIMSDTTLLQGTALRTDIAPGVMRMTVTDKALIETLRKARPGTALFRFSPCVRPVGSVARQCMRQDVPITYP